MRELIIPIIRRASIAAGAYLVSEGYSETVVDQFVIFVAAGMTICTDIVIGWVNKRKKGE